MVVVIVMTMMTRTHTHMNTHTHGDHPPPTHPISFDGARNHGAEGMCTRYCGLGSTPRMGSSELGEN